MADNEESDAEFVETEDIATNDNYDKRFQKTIWQLRLLPYYEGLKHEADQYFSNIKTGLAHSLLYKDIRPGFVYWVHELDRYIQLYSRRFTRTDHINLIKLLHHVLSLESLDFRVVKVVASSLTQLLARKNLLTRKDLSIDWKPLYNLYSEIAYKKLEEDGVLLLPPDLKKSLGHTILECNHFFADNATQEILDEIRPFFCPTDDSMVRALSLANLFLPTDLNADEHDLFGAKLWIDELWHWFMNACQVRPIQEKILAIFSKLAKDMPGYIDWSDKLELICSHLLSTFKLQVGIDKITMDSTAHFHSSAGMILIYTLGGEENISQKYFDKLFHLLKSYLHPSNYGAHTTTILTFFLKLSTTLVTRINRERFRPSRLRQQVPPQMLLTDEQIDGFVKSILPCLKFSAFSKYKDETVCSVIRYLCFLSPGIIIPFVLDLVYPALDSSAVKEPHRLTQSLGLLASICVPLVKHDLTKSGGQVLPIEFLENENQPVRSLRINAITVLNNLLPGLDINDMRKSALTFQIVGTLLALIPLVDCSDAIHIRNDLTDEERELCSATANFDSLIDQLTDKSLALLEMLNDSHTNYADRRALNSKSKIKNIEEAIIERGVVNVFQILSRNCTSATYMRIFNQFHHWLTENIFCSKITMEVNAKVAASLIGNNPSYAFPIMLRFIIDRLRKILVEDVYEEDEVEPSIIWYLTLASRMILLGIDGKTICESQNEIDQLLSLILPFKKCKTAFILVAQFCQNLLAAICSLWPKKNFHELNDQGFDQYLPIRHWAQKVDKNKCDVKWYIPTESEKAYAESLINRLIFDTLEVLSNPTTLSDAERLKHITLVRNAFDGCSILCPSFDGEVMPLIPMKTENVQFNITVVPSTLTELTSKDGTNLRRSIFEKLVELGEFLLVEKENDTESALQFIGLIMSLLHVRGIDQASYASHSAGLHAAKRLLSDPLRGTQEMSEVHFDSQIAFLHFRRLLTKPLVGMTSTHLAAIKLLMKFSISLYSSVRTFAQTVLDSSFLSWLFSYKLVLDEILYLIENSENYTHEQFKGALYMLLNGKEVSVCVRQDWESLCKIWPALVKAKYSDKPSIIALFDLAQDIVVNNFSSFQVTFLTPNSVIPFAKQLLQDYDGCVHKPVWALPTEEALLDASARENAINEKNSRFYYQLCSELMNLSMNKRLHRRKEELAEAYLSLLLRRDIDFPEGCILLFFRLLISDILKTRKMAVSLVGSWLKINKPKATKQPYLINMDVSNAPGARWPICYGYRKDNRFLLFDSRLQPNNEEEWNKTRFFYKVYWGFYVWPREFLSYAPLNEQNSANRPKNQFTAIESSILSLISEPNYFGKLISLFSLEEKKGSDVFDATNYQFFYRLFRSFNDAIFPLVKPHLEKLLEDKREGSQRLASEIVAGLINGSRLWLYRKVETVWNWLESRLMLTLETINAEAEANWGSCFATIYAVCDTRSVSWLTNMLFALIKKPSDNSFHVKARLYLLHCAIGQLEWRAMEYWQRLTRHCLEMVDQPFKDVRVRVGSCLAMSTFCDFNGIYIDPDIASDFNIIRVKDLVPTINSKIKALWNKVLANGVILPLEEIGKANDESKREKLVLVTLCNTLYGLSAQGIHNLDSCIIELIPILAHFSNEVTEEELKSSSTSHLIRTMGLSLIKPTNIGIMIETCKLVNQRSIWWKSKISMLRFLQVFTVTNMFVLEPYKESILDLLLSSVKDPQYDVRMMAADTFSGLLQCGLLSIDEKLLSRIYQQASSSDPIQRHAGILTLSGIVMAFPYSVPSFVPHILMTLCRHATDKAPVKETVKKALNEFKRTHHDSWHEHKLEFDEEQLETLTNLMVSPNYYV